MKQEQIQRFVSRYLEATDCHVIEKSPHHLMVKLSPMADKDLTSRPYYWSFVEKTGVPPETMTLTLVFDPERMDAQASKTTKTSETPPNPPARPPVARIPRDDVIYGSRRLEQIFNIVKQKGRFVQLFEEPTFSATPVLGSSGMATWLVANFRVELLCDMKRDELHSLAIHLSTGQIVGNFHSYLTSRKLTPRFPAHIHITPSNIPLADAMHRLEQHLEQQIRTYDHSWADEAHDRWQDELARVEAYYTDLLQNIEPEQKEAVEAQYHNRLEEIEWQHRPRIQVSVTNCGLFHIVSEHFS